MKTRIGILPSMVTLGNLVCGFAAIGVTAQGQLHWRADQAGAGWASFALAGSLILLAMVFDVLDGRIARMANLTSEFGAQLDSLCDVVSFGLAPAYIVFLEAASRPVFRHPRYAWVCAVLYLICTALRLARFNVETAPDEESHRYFRGLPSPAAAGVIASLAIFDWKMETEALWAARIMPFAAVALGGLMVTRLRYIHLVGLLFRERKPFVYLAVLVFAVFTILVVWTDYEYILLAGFVGYAVSGPVHFLWRLARRRRAVQPGAAPPADISDADNEDLDDDSIF